MLPQIVTVPYPMSTASAGPVCVFYFSFFFFLSHPPQTTFRFPLPPTLPSSNHKQSRPSLALTPPPPKMRPAKRDLPPRCAPSSNASARTPIEKAFCAHQNDTPRP